MNKRILLLCLLAAPLLAGADSRIVIRDKGFAAPESVVHDTDNDVYLLSNVNGRAIDNDGNGFISKIAPDGRILELEWIGKGKHGVTLHAPKGLAISASTLYVVDNGNAYGNVVKLFDVTTGKPLVEVMVPGSYFLNSLAALPNGDVLATDSAWQLSLSTHDATQPLAPGARRQSDGSTWTPTGQDAIYRIGKDRKVSVWLRSPELAQPNGIRLLESGNLLLASSSSAFLYELDLVGNKVKQYSLPDRGFDGVGQAPDGRFFAAGAQTLYIRRPNGEVKTVTGVNSHVADLDFDRQRKRLLLPMLRTNELMILPLEGVQ